MRVPAIVYYVSAFLLPVWHPEQQRRMNEWVSRGCWRQFLSFLLLFIVCRNEKWVVFMETARCDWNIRYLKKQKTKPRNYFVQLIKHSGSRDRQYVVFEKQMSFPPTLHSHKKALKFLQYVIFLPKLISRGQQCSMYCWLLFSNCCTGKVRNNRGRQGRWLCQRLGKHAVMKTMLSNSNICHYEKYVLL